MDKKEFTLEEISQFIEGHDPEERIVDIEYNTRDPFMRVIYRDENDNRKEHTVDFYPFCWATLKACHRLCDGNRTELTYLTRKYSIGCKKLSQTSIEGEERHEFDNGYQFMFFAKVPMSYKRFQDFFKEARNPLYMKDEEKEKLPKEIQKQYLVPNPREQFLISTGKRYFKGYDDYDQLLRLIFDLETTGLDTRKDRINQIGIRTNRPSPGFPNGFQKILTTTGETEEDKDASELKNIEEMLKIISIIKPDIITGHNIEAFDWSIIIGACERLQVPLDFLSKKYFNGESIKKDTKDTVLKLGGEVEYFQKTNVPDIIVTDSLHAVRRAQAIDSNMLRADLKYVTEYSKMKKENRVYVPGEKISETWNDTVNQYAFCDKNGDWYKYDPTLEDTDNGEIYSGKKSFIPTHGFIRDGYELTTGKYIVERYLFDDLYEADKVEYRYNTPNFLICKMLPVPYDRCVTMGTAVQWKAIMLAWSYENGLAIPMFGERKSFVGGLSRLLQVGFVENVAKFDYNSLYPSIILTWGISDKTDLMRVMLKMLEYALTQREKYKVLKKKAGKKKEEIKELLANFSGTKAEREKLQQEYTKYASEESFNDKKQLPLKVLQNGFFGSYGAPNIFPFGSMKCAEQVTCTGRMALRLMISYFKSRGYEPIVGDSFTEDTPLFIRYIDTGEIDIKPICELINEEEVEVDALGREYDYSEKSYEVLCRSGWVSPSYIYRHKTDKDIYEVSEGDMKVDVTEDHSLFNSAKEKIKPSEINETTELEYYTENFDSDNKRLTADFRFPECYAKLLANGEIDRVPMWFLNRPSDGKKFYKYFMENYRSDVKYSKTCLAGLLYCKNFVTNNK